MKEAFDLISNQLPIEKLEQEGIILIAPGLSGDGIYIGSSTAGGIRAIDDEVGSLDEAIHDAGLESRHTLVIEAPTPDIQTKQGGRSALQDVANDEMLLQVPSEPDEIQFVIYADEAGIITFHYPQPTDASSAPPLRARTQNQYILPLRNAQGQSVIGEKLRGPFGKIGSKIIKVVVGKILKKQVGKAAHWAIEEWENRARTFQGLHGGKDFVELMQANPIPFKQWDAIRGKKALLFIHGTSSSTAGAFQGLLRNDNEVKNAIIPQTLYERYENRVLAFNHHTMSIGVADNVKQFYDAFRSNPGHYRFDVICHSRGGLVARALTQLPTSFLGDWQYPEGVQIDIDRIVFVAAPNAGTDLARKGNIPAMAERLANYVNLFPDGALSISAGMILALVSGIAEAGLHYVPGLEDQSPDSELVNALMDSAADKARYYASEANHEVTGNLLTVLKEGVISAGADLLVDKLFSDKPNDVVVPTLGVSDNTHFKLDEDHVYRFSGKTVHHTNLFFQPEMDKILEFLAAT